MSDDYFVGDVLYYRLLAAQNGLRAAELAAQLAARDLADVQHLIQNAATAGGYKLTADFVLSEHERTIPRTKV